MAPVSLREVRTNFIRDCGKSYKLPREEATIGRHGAKHIRIEDMIKTCFSIIHRPADIQISRPQVKHRIS